MILSAIVYWCWKSLTSLHNFHFIAAIDQQPNLSQPSSLADVQNNGTWQQQRQQLDEAIDRAIETGERIVLRDRGMGEFKFE